MVFLLIFIFLLYYLLTTFPPQEWRDYAIGRFYFFKNQEEKASKEFNVAVAKAKDKANLLLEIGKLYLSIGDLKKGEEFVRESAQKHPSPYTYYLLGQFYYRHNKLNESEQYLKKALELDPTNPYVLNDLGYIWVEQGKNLDEAVRMLELAVKKVRSPEVLDSLGWAYVKTGRVEEGLKLLKKAVVGNPRSWEIRYHLGVAYEKMGKIPFAQVELNKADILRCRIPGV